MQLLFIFSILIVNITTVLNLYDANQKKTEKIFVVRTKKAIMKISANGGRIISFKLGNSEIITNKSEHENFGSTLWTAPQSDWGWPPYDTLDNQEYQVEKIGDTISMISKPDFKSGLQFEKKIFPIKNRFIRIEYRIHNITKKEKSVAAWEVTRVPSGGLAFFHAGGKGEVPKSSLKIDLIQDNINWVLIDKKPMPAHKKLFATASEGWLGYAFKDVLFIKQFPDTKPEDYSPKQGEVEIYANKEKNYVELENQGPYSLLKPGQSLSYIVNWQLVAIPEKIKCEEGNKKLTSFANKQVTLITKL